MGIEFSIFVLGYIAILLSYFKYRKSDYDFWIAFWSIVFYSIILIIIIANYKI